MNHLITIPNWRPTPLNKLLGNRYAAARLKKSDREIVAAYAHLLRVEPATTKRRVYLTVQLGPTLGTRGKGSKRVLDCDAMWKSLLDALVHAKMLVKDTPEWCETAPPVQFRGAATVTTIELVDIAAESVA